MRQYEELIFNKIKIDYKKLHLGELGNQDYNGKPAKILYNKKGTIHTSIDINGMDGALPYDLAKPISDKFNFDVLTNYGTTEHVENQYECFRNIHNMVKIGGLMIHGVPLIGNWPGHCRYYYNRHFFISLASVCKYEVVDQKIWRNEFYAYPRNLVSAVLRKKENNEFITKEDFISIGGIFDSGNKANTQNYTMKLKSGMRSVNDGLLDLIKDLPNDITMAEVGSYAGESTLMFLKSGKVKKLYAIDPWKNKLDGEITGTKEFIDRVNYVYSNIKWAEDSFDVRIKPYEDIVVKMKMTFKEAQDDLPQLDFIYIDGDHRFDAVCEDIVNALRILKKGGILAGHDYNCEGSEVVDAVKNTIGSPDREYRDTSFLKFII